jgi:hypothetical protein
LLRLPKKLAFEYFKERVQSFEYFKEQVRGIAKLTTAQTPQKDQTPFSRLKSWYHDQGLKFRSGLKELPFLGQIMSKNGYHPDLIIILAVVDLQPPANAQQLRRVWFVRVLSNGHSEICRK